MLGDVGDTQDEFGEQVADLRLRESDDAWFADTDSPFTAKDRDTASQAWAGIDRVMCAYPARQDRTW